MLKSLTWGLQSIWNASYDQSEANHSLDRESSRYEPFNVASTYEMASNFYCKISKLRVLHRISSE
jgi:hypothetical protein